MDIILTKTEVTPHLPMSFNCDNFDALYKTYWLTYYTSTLGSFPPHLYHLEIILITVEIPFHKPYLDGSNKMHCLTYHISTMIVIYISNKSHVFALGRFYGLWFTDKGSEIAKAREWNQMNLNTWDNAVVQISFFLLLFSYLRWRAGVEYQYSKSAIFGHF